MYSFTLSLHLSCTAPSPSRHLCTPTTAHPTLLQDYISLIDTLPESDSPAMLGLPANIERLAQKTTSSSVLRALNLLLRPDEALSQFNREHWSKELGGLLSLWKKLNQGTDLVSLKLSPPEESNSPVEGFVVLERYNAVKCVQVSIVLFVYLFVCTYVCNISLCTVTPCKQTYICTTSFHIQYVHM